MIDSSASGRLKEICPRGNNKVVLFSISSFIIKFIFCARIALAPDIVILEENLLHVWKYKQQIKISLVLPL